MYCTAGIRWFVVNGAGVVFPCHVYWGEKLSLGHFDNFKIKDIQEKCLIQCDHVCDRINTQRSSDINSIQFPNYVDIVFYLNEQCFMECPYCEFKPTPSVFLSTQSVQTILEKLKMQLQVKYFGINLSGGEPALSKNLSEIMNVIHKTLDHYHIKLFTSLISIKQIAEFQNSKIKESLKIVIAYHPVGKTFNLYKFLERLNFLIIHRYDIEVHMVDHAINRPFIGFMRDLCEKKRIFFKLNPNAKLQAGDRENILLTLLNEKKFKKI